MPSRNIHGSALDSLLGDTPVVPVVVLGEVAAAVPLARALLAGGLRVIEVTLRTPTALAVIAAMTEHVPDAIVGAGTVLEPAQFAAAAKAGARFTVSPGASSALLEAASSSPVPWLPGASTASEVQSLRERGYRLLKFFPAEPGGGTGFLRAIYGPIPDVRFCPTGGVDESSAARYLALPNVACVGGSWLAPSSLLAARNWDEIRQRAVRARDLRPSVATPAM